MYVIIVYDVEQERVNRVFQFLRRYLNWVQNSAFEGEVTEAQLERIRMGLRDRIAEEKDSVYIYILRDERWIRKEILGQERGRTDAIL